ncbi:MAG: hypothetical protein H6558_10145 [Lewinellaceae bacterium]|nr:hypothetical protein [Lewinellaceae bacterium]MCB9288596.1 hypothetical protein [Lewinellaceae bacterium]
MPRAKTNPLLLLFLFCLFACDKWDLEQQEFIRVELTSIDSLAMDSVRLSGRIVDLSLGQVQDHGFVWSAREELPEAPYNEAVSLGTKTKEESQAFSDTLKLAINTAYTLRAYATLDGITYFYSEPFAYQTGSGSVITLEAVYERGLEVELKGRLSGTDKGIVALQHGFCWSTVHTQPTLADSFANLGYRRNDEPFSYIFNGLQGEIPYYFRAYAVRSINFQQDTAYGEVLLFDRDLNFWAQKADLADGERLGAVGFSIGQKGYIGTGSDGGGYRKDFWEYDPQTNTWSQKADLAGGGRYSAVGFSIGQKGYVGTGYNDGYRKDFWEYFPD